MESSGTWIQIARIYPLRFVDMDFLQEYGSLISYYFLNFKCLKEYNLLIF